MKKYLKKIVMSLALATSLLSPLETKSQATLTQSQDYGGNWNTNATVYLDSLGETGKTKKISRINLNANNLLNGINYLKVYAAGIADPSIQLYDFYEEYFYPIKNIIISPQNTSWQIESITNLGKSPKIFGITNGLVFVEENPTNTQIRFDNNTRVFNRDIYQITLATSNGAKYTNFNLDLDLITDDENTTNNSEICALVNVYNIRTNIYEVNLDAYLNRIFGKMNQTLDASKDDWNTNGIPNSFEATYSSGPTNMITEADEDNDGANNLQEYNAGTNPSDSNSVFKVTGLEAITNTTKITWNGSLTNFFYNPVNYSVESSTNLQDNNSWNIVASNLNTQTYSDTNLGEKAFFRVKTQSE